MDSINREQPEANREDLVGSLATSKIRELVERNETCFFCTSAQMGDSVNARPMTVQEVDESGNLWFLSAADSHKNTEVEGEPAVRLYFQASKHSGFLYLDGTVSVSRDKSRIKDLWEPVFKTWFTDGIDDERITVIKFTPREGYYWDTKHGQFVAGIKMLIGAVAGVTLDDSIEGSLRKV